MFIISNFLFAMARIVDIILIFFYWTILLRALISWVNPDPFNPVVQFLYRVTEPILQPIRRVVPTGRIDFSPIIAFLVIIFLQAFLVASLRDLAYNLRDSKTVVIETPGNVAPKGETFFK